MKFSLEEALEVVTRHKDSDEYDEEMSEVEESDISPVDSNVS